MSFDQKLGGGNASEPQLSQGEQGEQGGIGTGGEAGLFGSGEGGQDEPSGRSEGQSGGQPTEPWREHVDKISGRFESFQKELPQTIQQTVKQSLEEIIYSLGQQDQGGQYQQQQPVYGYYDQQGIDPNALAQQGFEMGMNPQQVKQYVSEQLQVHDFRNQIKKNHQQIQEMTAKNPEFKQYEKEVGSALDAMGYGGQGEMFRTPKILDIALTYAKELRRRAGGDASSDLPPSVGVTAAAPPSGGRNAYESVEEKRAYEMARRVDPNLSLAQWRAME